MPSGHCQRTGETGGLRIANLIYSCDLSGRPSGDFWPPPVPFRGREPGTKPACRPPYAPRQRSPLQCDGGGAWTEPPQAPGHVIPPPEAPILPRIETSRDTSPAGRTGCMIRQVGSCGISLGSWGAVMCRPLRFVILGLDPRVHAETVLSGYDDTGARHHVHRLTLPCCSGRDPRVFATPLRGCSALG